jgi:hypothetical protein
VKVAGRPEISRARVAPADRAGVRKFLARFEGGDLEVALEATTGWRFVVEELQRVGADVQLAEPAETSGLKGKKKRAKTDWADARHLGELLLIGRLPESWIAPAHLLDLRARVRCRHTLSHQRTEWQQRMQAVLYHHGIPQRRASAAWSRSRSSPSSATPAGFPTPGLLCATAAWTSPSTNPISTALPGTSPAKAPQRCAGRGMKPRNLLKRSYHILKELGDPDLEPVAS